MKYENPEEERLALWLRQVARRTPPRPLPSAGQLWWRAQIIRRLVAEEALADKATRPLRWSEWAGLAVLSLLLGLLFASFGPSLAGAFEVGLSGGGIGGGWLFGLLVGATALPLLGCGVLWLLWREAT